MGNPKVFSDVMYDRNPRVFFDIEIGGVHAGRMVMELFADTTPKAAEKFRALCTGENGIGKNGKPLHYKGSIIEVFKATSLACLKGGFRYQNYVIGKPFEKECNYYRNWHTGPGNLFFFDGDSSFRISLEETPAWPVVFGKILDGKDVLKAIESVGDRWGAKPVIVANCGQLNGKVMKYNNLKKYGPKYHNMIKGSKIPRKYVYRSSKGRDPNSRILL